MTTIEVLEARFEDHLRDSSLQFKEIKKEIDNKVPYKTFMLIFVILSGVLGFMMIMINDIRTKTTDISEKAASITYWIDHHNFN